MLASDQDKHRGCVFHAYYLPRDRRAELAHALSMAEGRAGRVGGEALDDAWADPTACERILRKACSGELGDRPPGYLLED
eukprot:14256374-Alexandrium_andersonii.AAC.1